MQGVNMNLREQFEKETETQWINSQKEPDIDYVYWLEEKINKIHNVCHDVEELKDGYHDTEAQLRDEILTDIVKIIDE